MTRQKRLAVSVSPRVSRWQFSALHGKSRGSERVNR